MSPLIHPSMEEFYEFEPIIFQMKCPFYGKVLGDSPFSPPEICSGDLMNQFFFGFKKWFGEGLT